MRAILAAIDAGMLPGQGLVAISNNADAAALGHAASHGVRTLHISATSAGSAEQADKAIAAAFDEAGVGLVVLSGYLRPVGPAVLGRFRNRVLNIHPALLPKFGGRGMFGDHVHAAVLASGEAETGATVHLVDGEYDHGAVLAQMRVPVLPGDTVETVRARVMAAEPGLFVQTLRAIADGAIVLP